MPRKQFKSQKLGSPSDYGEFEKAASAYLSEIEGRPDEKGRVVKISELDNYAHPKYGRVFNKLRSRKRGSKLKEWVREHHPGIILWGDHEYSLRRAMEALVERIPKVYGDDVAFSVNALRYHETDNELQKAARAAYSAIRALRRSGVPTPTLHRLLSEKFPTQLITDPGRKQLRQFNTDEMFRRLVDQAERMAVETHGIRTLSFEHLKVSNPDEWRSLVKAWSGSAVLKERLREKLPTTVLLDTRKKVDTFRTGLEAIASHVKNTGKTSVDYLLEHPEMRNTAWLVKRALERIPANRDARAGGKPTTTLGTVVEAIAIKNGIEAIRTFGPRRK